MKKLILLFAFPLMLISCLNTEEKTTIYPQVEITSTPESDREYKPVGKYVYTYGYTVHTNLHCRRIYGNPNRVKSDDFCPIYTNSIGRKMKMDYCSNCVSDEEYEWMSSRDTIQ